MMSATAPFLVLGAGGLVGRKLHVVWPADWPVRWHSRTPEEGFESCDLLAEPDRLVTLARGCSAVLCLAGVTDRTHNRTGADYAQNSRLAQAAILAAQKAGCRRVLLSSSAAVYGRAEGVLQESNTGLGLSRYGTAKREMETAGAALGQATGVDVCSLRIGNLAGADAILGGWQPGFTLDVFDDAQTPQRSYLGFGALVAVLQSLSRVSPLPPVLNLAQPGLVAMGDLLDAAGLPWNPRPAPSSAVKTVHLSTGLLERTIGKVLPAASANSLVKEWRRSIAAPARVV